MSGETTVEVVAVPEELQAVAVREGVAANTQQALVSSFAPHHAAITEALHTARQVTDGTNPLQRKLARECRLELRRARCAVEDARKTAKADALRYGKAVDGMANVLKFLCEPEESRLDGIERYEEIQEERRIAQFVEQRAAELTAEGGNPVLYNLGAMDDATWGALIGATRKQRQDKIEAERQAEAARIAAEKAAQDERERLQREAAEAKAAADAERKARAEAEAKAAAERAKIEAERQKERKEAEAKQRKAEEEARKARAEAEAEKAKEAKRLADIAEEKRKADAAPDKAKLEACVAAFAAIVIPALSDADACKIASGVDTMRAKLVAWARERISAL